MVKPKSVKNFRTVIQDVKPEKEIFDTNRPKENKWSSPSFGATPINANQEI